MISDGFAHKIVEALKLQQIRRALIVSAPAYLQKAAIPFIQYPEIIYKEKTLMGGVFREKIFFLFEKHFVLIKTPTKSNFNSRLR